MNFTKKVIFPLFFANIVAFGLPLSSLTNDITNHLISAFKGKMEVDDVVQNVISNLNLSFPINSDKDNLLQKLLPDDSAPINRNGLVNLLRSLTEKSDSTLDLPLSDVQLTNKKSFESLQDSFDSENKKEPKKAAGTESQIEKRNPDGELLKLMRKMRKENRMRFLNNEILMSAYQHILDA